MEPNPENGKSTNEGGNKRTVLIVIIILLLANAFLLWQFFSKKSENATLTQENIEVNADKDSISAEYETVKVELNKLQADNTSLQGKLSENDAAIVKQKEKIDKLMRENASLPTLRSEVKKLKDMKSQYEVRIAELETQNLQLTSENKDLNTNLTGEKTKNESLSKENQGLSNKVALGSILRAEEIVAKGVRFKSSGKEIEENKSKNVQKIRTCFTIRENVVVDKGQKDIFLRIMDQINQFFLLLLPRLNTTDSYCLSRKSRRLIMQIKKLTSVCIGKKGQLL